MQDELKSGSLVITDKAELVLLDYFGKRPFVRPGDVQEFYSGVILRSPDPGHNLDHMDRRWTSKNSVRPVAYIDDLVRRWELATHPDLTTPAEVPDWALTDVERLQRENKRLADRLAKLEGAKA